MKLKMILNPAAGRGRALRRIDGVVSYLRDRGGEVDVHQSASPRDLTSVAAESSRGGYDRVVVCGGDGTVHLAIREFDLQRGTLAVIPSGSGDDFARVAGVPLKWELACDAVLAGAVREVDVALANGTRFVCIAGLGFDSEVTAFANSNAKYLRGSAIYLYSILRVLPRFRPYRMSLRIDGVERTERIMMVMVGNSPQYGGGIRIVPAARIDDSLLDFCIVHETSRLTLLKTLPRVYNGSHVRSPYVETGRGREFHFQSERPLAVFADGEMVTETPVTIGFAAEKLKLVV